MQTAARPLTIAHVDAETGFSGGEVQVFLLLEGLRKAGHRCVLFCPPRSRSEAEAAARGFEVRSIPMRADLDLSAVKRLAQGFEALEPDLVHLHTGRATWLGGLAARWRGLPAITTRRQDKRLRPGLRTRLIYGHLARAVAISPAVARRLAEGGLDPARIELIPSSTDPGLVEPRRGRAALRDELSLAPDACVLLVLAALVRRKGHDVLLDALARLDPAPPLLIAGDGEERAALEAQAQRLGLSSVRFLGRREDKGDLLAACDVFVLPSRLEGLGVAALEAMAAGRPVVASRVGGLAEAVGDESAGLLVPPEDPAALAAALERLIGDPGLRQAFGVAGRARIAQGFLAGQMVNAYETLYRRVLAEGAAR